MIVLIDGRSGAGKTTLATRLAAVLGWPVVHLDDMYPGWEGLSEATEMVVRDVLRADNPGYWRWDWERNRRAEWVPLEYEHLIVEGAGCISDAALDMLDPQDHLALVVDLAASKRKKRALERDPEYAPFWELWARQEDAHFARFPWDRVHTVPG